MALDVEEFRRRKQPETRECAIALDPEAIDALAQAREARDAAASAVDASADPASARAALSEAEDVLEAAEDAAREATQVFRFKALPAEDFDLLLGEHQPTPDQLRKSKKAGRTPIWNEDTFPQVLVAAALIEPAWSEDDVATIWKGDTLNAAEKTALFDAAWRATQSRRVPELGKGSGRTLS